MGNAAGTKTSREEEIAFLALEQVLNVDIRLADAGTGNNMPDGTWVYPGKYGHHGIVEVTSPPDKKLMGDWAYAKRMGDASMSESGSMSVCWNGLAQVCTELLAQDWAVDNVDKLLAEQADERHLFLFGRSYRVSEYFYRLSDEYIDRTTEQIDDLDLPDGITDIWFLGRAQRDDPMGTTELRLSRFQVGVGWRRHIVRIDERSLPSPNLSIADDVVGLKWRQPKDRTL